MSTTFTIAEQNRLLRSTRYTETAVSDCRIGVITGRFQPFHLGHFNYFRCALAQCDKVIIGITNPDPMHSGISMNDLQRHKPANNPFTFYERKQFIDMTMHDQHIMPENYEVVPMPINNA